MAQVWFEINAAGSELEIVAGAVLDQGVVAIRTAQATLDAGRICGAARRGSLCKPQRDQQGRYNDQQACSLNEILRRFSPCGGLKFRLGFDSASDFSRRTRACFGLQPENLGGIQVKHHNLSW